MYKEINPEEWTYEKEGDFIEGKLVEAQQDVGVNKSKLYSIETSEGDVKNIWGSAILNSKMNLTHLGDQLRITYQGLAEPKGGKNAAKIFTVEVDQEDKVKTEKID